MKDWKNDLLGWAMTAIVVFAVCSACSSCMGQERAYDSIQNQRIKQIEGRMYGAEKKLITHESWIRSLGLKVKGLPRGGGSGDVDYPDPLFPPPAKVADDGAAQFSVADGVNRKLDPIPEQPVSTHQVLTGWLHTYTWTYGWHPGMFGPRLGWGWIRTTRPIYESRPNAHYYAPRPSGRRDKVAE